MTEFLRQNYHTHKKLKPKWRRPKGKQSKLRVNKGGSGVRPRIGFKGTGGPLVVVSSMHDLEQASGSVLLSGQMGSKKAAEIAKRAGELGIKILNKRKLKRSERIARNIESRKKDAKKKPEPKETAEKPEEEKKE